MGDDIRYWIASDLAATKFRHNADNLLSTTKKHVKKYPEDLSRTVCPVHKILKESIRQQDQPHKGIYLKWSMNNNMMERLNGTIRDQEKMSRGFGQCTRQCLTA